jgi:hypothetical protein
MANLSTKIHEAVSRLLEDKEEIRAVGQLQKKLSPLIGWFVTSYITSFWYVAITNLRVIFIKLTIWSKPDFAKTYSVPLSEVSWDGEYLSVGKADPNLPKHFELYFGLNQVTGLDKNVFVQFLTQVYKNGDQIPCEACGKKLTVKYFPQAQILTGGPGAMRGIALRCQECGFITCIDCAMKPMAGQVQACPSCKKMLGPTVLTKDVDILVRKPAREV